MQGLRTLLYPSLPSPIELAIGTATSNDAADDGEAGDDGDEADESDNKDDE